MFEFLKYSQFLINTQWLKTDLIVDRILNLINVIYKVSIVCEAQRNVCKNVQFDRQRD